MAGGFRQTDVPGDHGGEHLAREVPPDFLRYLRAEVGAAVVHGQGHGEDLQSGVDLPLHHPKGAHEVRQTLQREVFTLDRHKDGIRGAQAVEGQHLQRGRTVDEDHIIELLYLLQGFLQLMLPMLRTDQLHRRAGQIRRGGQDIAVGRMDDGILGRYIVDDHIIDRMLDLTLVHAQTGAGVGLRIEITQQDPDTKVMERGGQVHGGGGLTHSALLVHNGDRFCHRPPPYLYIGCFT